MRLDPHPSEPIARLLFLVASARPTSRQWERTATNLLLEAGGWWEQEGVHLGEAAVPTRSAWAAFARKLLLAESTPIAGISVFRVDSETLANMSRLSVATQ